MINLFYYPLLSILATLTGSRLADDQINDNFITHDRCRYRVVFSRSSYHDAVQNCYASFNSSLPYFSLVSKYFNLVSVLQIHKLGDFWLAGAPAASLQPISCQYLYIRVVHDGSDKFSRRKFNSILRTTDCNTTKRCYSICSQHYSTPEVDGAILDSIERTMRVPPNSTLRSHRKLSSVPDGRTSSVNTGKVAVVVLALTFGLIVLVDVANFFSYWRKERQKRRIGQLSELYCQIR